MSVITITERHGDILPMCQAYQAEGECCKFSLSHILMLAVRKSPMYLKWKKQQKAQASDPKKPQRP